MPVGSVDLGALRRLTPISRSFGCDRGRPIDRYYIDRFLEKNSACIGGRVAEFADDEYTRRFGGARVTHSDVLHPAPGNTHATIIADLASAEHIASASFDCIICTQVLMYIYDIRAAIRTLRRILRPGGTLLASIPGISQISPLDMEQWGEFWRLTSVSARRLFAESFGMENTEVTAHGNVLASIAFLHGLAVEELTNEELDYADPFYELTIVVKAQVPKKG